MRWRSIVSTRVFVMALALALGGVGASLVKADPAADWQQFRTSYPYHIQTLAMSRTGPDGSRTLIISEPPPHVDLEQIRAQIRAVNQGALAEIKRHPIGNDGWVEDVVVTISGNDRALAPLVGSLARLLFHTSYKAYVLELPRPKAPDPGSHHLDLRVSTADLERWLVKEKATFTPLEGGTGVPLDQVVKKKASGIYFTPGLVGWWIPKGVRVADCPVPARQFALDSDLIVGAMAVPEGLLVLGRERLAPIDVLPPLRVETVALLASVDDAHLAQSYTRDHVLAGKLDAVRDWAPVFLSDALIDTEYGSLLNIADQLLKRWTEAGDTDYTNFDYPQPKTWPFDGSLLKLLKADSLVYNWNTKGAGYVVSIGRRNWFALNRTGGLPATYIALRRAVEGEQGAVVQLDTWEEENQAYQYFAGLSDPYIVRVMQYTAIYQIFQAFPTTDPPKSVAEDSTPRAILAPLLLQWLREARKATDDEIGEITRRTKDEMREAGYQPTFDLLVNLFVHMKHEQKLLQDLDEDDLAKLANNLADLGRHRTRKVDPTADMERFFLSHFAALKRLPQRCAEGVASRAKGWIHTPVVVVSSNRNKSIGGHNIDAKIGRYRVTEEVEPGKPERGEIDGQPVILIHPEDANVFGGAVRKAARAGDDPGTIAEDLPELHKTVEVRPRDLALGRGSPPPPEPPEGPGLTSPLGDDGRGVWGIVSPLAQDDLLPRVHGSSRQARGWFRGGWWPWREALPAEVMADIKVQRRPETKTVHVQRFANGTIRVAPETGNPFVGYAVDDAADFVTCFLAADGAPKQRLRMRFLGFTEDEAEGLVRTCEARAKEGLIDAEIAGLAPDERTTPEQIRRFFTTNYDFKNTEPPEVAINDRPGGGQELIVTIDVPAAEPKARAKLSAHVASSAKAPAGLLVGVRDRLVNFMNAALGRSTSMFDLIDEIHQELKAIQKETGEDIERVKLRFRSGVVGGSLVREEQAHAPREVGA